MDVWVVFGIDYVPSSDAGHEITLVGVYETERRAKNAIKRGAFDLYEVRKRTLNKYHSKYDREGYGDYVW